MPDLLLLPIVPLAILALRAVRRGEYRLHGHLMLAAWACFAARSAWAFPSLPTLPRRALVLLLGLALATLALGRLSLAWREGDTRLPRLPRFHRAAGSTTLIVLALVLAGWFLRRGIH